MDEPQQIVSTRKLYCLQYHDLNTSSVLATIQTILKCKFFKASLKEILLVSPKTTPPKDSCPLCKDNVLLNTFKTVNRRCKIISMFSSDFDLRGFQSLSAIWRVPTVGYSTKWLSWRDDQTVPLVLGLITSMIISLSFSYLFCQSVGEN